MRKLGAFLLAAAGSLAALTARADCVLASQATQDSSCVVLARDGQRGVWLSLPEADRRSQETEALATVRAALEKQRTLTSLRETEANLWQQAATERKAQADSAKIEAVQAREETKRANDALAAAKTPPLPAQILRVVLATAVGAGAGVVGGVVIGKPAEGAAIGGGAGAAAGVTIEIMR